MPDEKLPLTIRPGSSIALVGSQGGRIVAEMVDGALSISRADAHMIRELTPRFTIGDSQFCEPDYLQILRWASSLALTPEIVVERLLVEPDKVWEKKYQTEIVNGRIKQIFWKFDLLPTISFELNEGLLIEALVFETSARFRPAPFAIKSTTLKSLGCGVGCVDLMRSEVPNLRKLDCCVNELADLDLSMFPLLTELMCSYNKFPNLNLKSVPMLEELWCSDNQLEELDLLSVHSLSKLWCCENRISKLELSTVPLLTYLRCSGNSLTKLDLSGIPQLTTLYCHRNQLSVLELSSVPKLVTLCCFDNQLTTLDVSHTPDLVSLRCQGNQLTELDIRPLRKLKRLHYDANRTRLIQRPDQKF